MTEVSGNSKLDWDTTSLAGVHLGPGVQGVQETAAGQQRESQLRATIEAVAAGDPCVSWDRDSTNHLYVQLPGPLIARVAGSIGRRASDLVLPLLTNDEVVCRLSLLLLEGAEAVGKPRHVYAESISTAVVAHLFGSNGTGQHQPSSAARLPGGSLRRITDYMQTHLEEKLSIRKLAAVVGLSPSHFSALFRRATGVSPHRFLIQRRVERARELLVSSTEAIAQIAVRVGFCDQSHLAKHMRHVLGLSPGRLRRTDKQFSYERSYPYWNVQKQNLSSPLDATMAQDTCLNSWRQVFSRDSDSY